MAATLRIPTIFTAVDKISSVVNKMGVGVTNFANKMQAGVSRGNRWFRKLTPTISEAGKQLLSFASTAALAGALVSGVHFSVQSLMDYENSVASFRTIVSDLSDKDFAKYKLAIGQVAQETRKSSIEVASSFEKIAGLNAKFAETAEGLSAVSKASIVLSKASGDELGVSAENLVGIMNQFSLKATEADRVINVLAAGQAVGAASITQTSESYKNFGSVAAGANITLEESVGLIQTLGKFSLFGAEAGTKLRGATLQLQKAGLGYASGQFNINDALKDAKTISDKLTTQRAKDTFMLKTFGAENISVGKILLANIPTYQEMTKQVTGTTEAHKAAAINSNTLSNRLTELKNSWVNLLTSNNEASVGMELTKNLLVFLAENISTVVSVGAGLLAFFVAWKAILIASEVVLGIYNIALGVTSALSGTAAIGIGKSTIALRAYKVVTAVVTAAQWLWNAALGGYSAASGLATAATTALGIAINIAIWPLTLVVVAILAIIAIFYYWDEIVAWFGEQWSNFTKWISDLWDKIVTGITEFDFIGFFMDIGKAIFDFMITPLEEVLKVIAKIPLIGGAAEMGLAAISEISASMDTSDRQKPALSSPEVAQGQATTESIQTQRNTIDLNVNDKGGNVSDVKSTGPLDIPIKTTPTNGQR